LLYLLSSNFRANLKNRGNPEENVAFPENTPFQGVQKRNSLHDLHNARRQKKGAVRRGGTFA
jgi:hypothetical protein